MHEFEKRVWVIKLRLFYVLRKHEESSIHPPCIGGLLWSKGHQHHPQQDPEVAYDS